MIEKSPKLIWGLLAVLIYALLIGLLLFYFNTRNELVPKHYVKKNEHRIQVSLSSQKKKKEKVSKPTIKQKVKPKAKAKKIKPKPKTKAKKIKSKPKIKEKKKKIIKEKIVKKLAKKKVDNNITKKPKKKKLVKKIKKPKVQKAKVKKTKIKKEKDVKKTADLFAKLNTKKHHKEKKKSLTNPKKTTKRPSALEKISKSANAAKSKDKGIENAYFAKVQSLLETWPAQSDFAGQKAMVRIYVKPTGQFEFKVKSKSNNIDFNLGLIDFLEQLQRLGLGKHNGGKTYEIEVEFTAKE